MDENKSVIEYLKTNDNRDSIQSRIGFVKKLLEDNRLEPLIEFDRTETDAFTGGSKDDDSNESFDTRYVLRKKFHDITDVVDKMGGTLTYVKSGSTGHTFHGKYSEPGSDDYYEYAVKVVPYSIKTKYGDMYDIGRPENAELKMIKLLSYFIVNKKTPHIILPIGTFDTDIENFTNLIEDGFVAESNVKYKEFVERAKKGEFYDKVSILISEWANRGDFLDYIKKNYHLFTPIHWKVFFYQLISTLAVIQAKYKSFRHNDMKANNILVTKISSRVPHFTYTITGNVYRVPNIGYQLKLWDFDFACIPGEVNNKKVMHSNKWSRSINVGPTQNRYYDIHYFFNTLMMKGFFPELMTHPSIPKEVKEFVNSIVPPEYRSGNSDCVTKRGRITKNVEFTTPEEILRTNPYFEEFRVSTNRNSTKTGYHSERNPKTHSHARSAKTDIVQDFLTGGNDPGIRISESIRELDMRSKSKSKERKESPSRKVVKSMHATGEQNDNNRKVAQRQVLKKDEQPHKSRSKKGSKNENGSRRSVKSKKTRSKSRSRSRPNSRSRSKNSRSMQSKSKKSRSKSKSRKHNDASRGNSLAKPYARIQSNQTRTHIRRKSGSGKSIDDINIEDILLGIK